MQHDADGQNARARIKCKKSEKAMSGDYREENSPALQHVDMVTRQIEMSAKELIGYVARLDRLERKMMAHSTKTSTRLVAITRRADAVIDALEQRSGSLGALCDEIGLRNAEASSPDIDPVAYDDGGDLIAHIDAAAGVLSTLADRLALLGGASDGGEEDRELGNVLGKLRSGMQALNAVIGADRAA